MLNWLLKGKHLISECCNWLKSLIGFTRIKLLSQLQHFGTIFPVIASKLV